MHFVSISSALIFVGGEKMNIGSLGQILGVEIFMKALAHNESTIRYTFHTLPLSVDCPANAWKYGCLSVRNRRDAIPPLCCSVRFTMGAKETEQAGGMEGFFRLHLSPRWFEKSFMKPRITRIFHRGDEKKQSYRQDVIYMAKEYPHMYPCWTQTGLLPTLCTR